MNLWLQEILASALAPKIVKETPTLGRDSLIAHGLKKAVCWHYWIKALT
ncbi:hypothetical protein Aazo_5315 (plasmid) ['Nostoc azollae' 0708]|uniref:Uncharacterized protein n=1 Tax=Nostoc azollae (strain 0708) TaxID=551115 RepID=D7E5P0_NOSA0|nr:hypothetical protein Aazo_5315 ['Nostoc azollae' 0708]